MRTDSHPVSEELLPLQQLNPWQELMSSQDDTVVKVEVKEEQVDFSIIPDSVTSISNSVTNGFVKSEPNGDSEPFPPYTSVTVATNHDVANKNNESKGQSLMIFEGDFLCMEPKICRFCQKQFYTHSDLVKHVKKSHLGQKPYRCTKCGMEFTRRDQWTVHCYCHTGVKPHSCTVCGQIFVHRQGLTVHMKIHRDFKPHSCPVCGKLFAHRSHRNGHMEDVHTVAKPSCPICGKRFSVGLKGHMRMHYCKKCGKLITRTNHLKGCET